MNTDEARELLARYTKNDCTAEEKVLVERWYLKEAAGQVFPEGRIDLSNEKAEIWAGIRIKAGLSSGRGVRAWVASAAAVLIVLSAALYFFRSDQPQAPAVAVKKADVMPGGNKALLTLADGSSIILDQAGNGTVAKQGNVVINKTADGQLIYDASARGKNNAIVGYNTISTPRGGEYQVILPDGSKVWLNSASSINFPTVFSESERNVVITGEAYFEVASNVRKPFIVKANGTRIQVLGTHFNVMAYTNEGSVKTTLLEGSVKVSSGRESNIIKPGEQAQIINGKINVSAANLEEAVAWKNGYFYFRNTDIKTVMRHISRWYDVDVEYRGTVPETVFSGKMYRNVNASKVLEILSYFKVNFIIEQPVTPSDKKTIVIL